MLPITATVGEAQVPGTSRWARSLPAEAETLSAEQEREILAACLAGDWSGYDLLVQRYRRLVWAAVDCADLDPALQEDLVQGVFIRAFEKLGTFRFRASFSSWLFRLARNHALSQRRSAQRRPPALSLEALRERSGAGHAAAGSTTPGAVGMGLQALRSAASGEDAAAQDDPEHSYALAARQQALSNMLRALPADQREALNLYYAADYSYEQIAEALGLPLNTVRTKLHRARLRLQALAEQQGWSSPDPL